MFGDLELLGGLDKSDRDATDAVELSRENLSLGEIVVGWLKPGREIQLGPGSEDEIVDLTKPPTLAILTLKSRETEIGMLAAPLDELSRLYSHIEPVSLAARHEAKCGERTCDDERIERSRKGYQINWNGERSQEEVSFEDGLEIALAYALSDIGLVWLRPFEPGEDDEVIAGEQLIQLDLHFQSPKSGVGWGESFLMRYPKA